MKKRFGFLAILMGATLLLGGCGSGNLDGGYMPAPPFASTPDMMGANGGVDKPNYIYGDIVENKFTETSQNNSSYFSLDRNTSSYSVMRTSIECKDSSFDGLRIEEMINYFDYSFASPVDKSIAITPSLAPCPWNEENMLMLLGIKTKEFVSESTNANYVFLVDVSGSMSGDKRIGYAKKGLNTLVDSLGDRDLVSIVTYASGTKTVLDGGECSEKGKKDIKNAISKLNANGSTNGEGGLNLAYQVAQKHFITGGNNRVIIISDGDFNVGMSSVDSLKEFIQEKAKTNIYLSVFGVGMGNFRDDLLETLATCGNGNYAYIDSEIEIKKVFVDELKGNLYTVAKDAKAGVKFSENVEKYRLIGYDTKIISEDDFNNDKADTGEIGSNLCVAVLYEIKVKSGAEGTLANAEIKYKDALVMAETSSSEVCEITMSTPSSDDLAFISCVAEFGLVLRKSQFKGSASIAKVLERLALLYEYTAADDYKKQFVTLVAKASEYLK